MSGNLAQFAAMRRASSREPLHRHLLLQSILEIQVGERPDARV